MASIVGSRGPIVIEKQIREQLGVKPGWQALQMTVDDHLEIHFLPPEHEESLLGAAQPFIRRLPAPGEDWDQAAAEDAAEAFLQKPAAVS